MFNDQYVYEDYLLTHSEGLICVISTDSIKIDIKNLVKNFKEIYYQIDLVKYSSNEKDKEHLLNIQEYLSEYSTTIEPVLICDAYYLDQEDHKIKPLINKIGKVGFKYQSKDQHFKSLDEIYSQFESLNLSEELFKRCLKNQKVISEMCQFKIDTKNFNFPKYILSKDEKIKFENNDDLFWYLIGEGFDKKISGKVEDESIYWERIEEEARVIQEGKIVDYFLILADIINWCHQNNILVGVGRGSSAGSLIAYCLNIVELDPIKYDLLFERFLNEARIKAGEMVDIDSDFESSRRDDVKRYMEQRYGIDHCASVGTYGNFKNKGIIKDFGREMNLNYSDVNFISSLIKDSEDGDLIDLFKESNKEPKLKDWINKNSELINKINLVIWQTKTQSIHASATLIVPFEDKDGNKKNIFDWLPVKKIDGILISEWEGKQVEAAGFLKEDILAILQLDKFRSIIDLIKKNHNIDIDWTRDIDVEDSRVYDILWKNGYTEDVFQFTTDNLKKYCKFLKPDRFEELIAANALARPGAMMSNAHIDYAKIKRGEQKPEYDYLLEPVTKKTFGLYIYQEQIMAAFKEITNSTLEEADLFRKIITKLKSGVQSDENFNKYKNLFVEAYIKKGSSEDNSNYVWDKLVAFSKYGFNRSHAACYAYEAYVCSWFKFHYPLEFWITSLKYSKDTDLEKKILEIEKTGSIKLFPPDINSSGKEYAYDKEKQIIYWALNSIKFAGDASVDNIIKERNENGNFYSLSEFLKRMVGKKVNKRVVTNFILCGCFDQIENITKVTDRYSLLKKYLGEDVSDEFTYENIIKDYFWFMKQKELCGIGNIVFNKIYDRLKKDIKLPKSYTYKTFEEINDPDNIDKNCILIGVILNVNKFNTKNGEAGRVEINENGKVSFITCWSDFWTENNQIIKSNTGKVLIISGVIRSFRNSNTLHTDKNSIIKVI